VPVIAEAIDRLIEALDVREGDIDLEDSEAGETAVTDRGRYLPEGKLGFGDLAPGDMEDAEPAWPEWHTRGRHKEPSGRLPHEDSEDDDDDACLAADDDPARIIRDGYPGDAYDTELNGDEGDYSDGGGAVPTYGADQSGPYMTDRSAGDSLAAVEPRWKRPQADDHLRPEDCPEVYASIAKGTCLEPIYRDGCCLAFSTIERPKPGDFVGVWFTPGTAPPGQPDRWVKRLVSFGPPGFTFFDVARDSPLQPFVVVEMLNPPREFVIPASRIVAIHKVIGEAQNIGGRWAVPKSLVAAKTT
jgi:hypothetical protein